MNIRKLLIGLLPIFIGAGTVRADYVWGGGENTWNTALAWEGGVAPARNTASDVIITNGVCNYDSTAAGGDITMSGTLTIGGTGKWIQSNGGNWSDFNGPVIVEEGGVLDTGVMPYFRTRKSITIRDGGTLIFQCGAGVEPGTARLYLQDGTIESKVDWKKGNRDLIPLTITGGIFKLTGSAAEFVVTPDSEFSGGAIQLSGSFTVTTSMTLAGTAVESSVVTLSSATGSIKLRAGSLAFDYAAADNGIATTGGYLDFPVNSSASLIVRNIGPASAYEAYGATGKIRVNGNSLSESDWAASITETETDDGLVLTCNAVSGSMAFADPGCGVFSRDTTAGTATLVAHVDAIDTAGTELYFVYGETNGGTSTLAAWEHTIAYGPIDVAGDYKGTVPLPADDMGYYYYRAAMKNADGDLVWADPAPYTLIRNGAIFQWLGGNGTWNNANLWSTGTAPAAGSSTLIENGEVTYSASADLQYWSTMTIRNGGTFNYSSGNWTDFRAGKTYVENGGRMVFPNVGLVRMTENRTVRISEGGYVSLKGVTGNTSSRGYYEVAGGVLEATGSWIAYNNGSKTGQSAILLTAGQVIVAGKYSAVSVDRYDGGELTIGDVFEMAEDHTVNGSTITATNGLTVTAADTTMTLSKGRLCLPTAGTAANHGIARSDSTSHVDLKTEFGAVLALGGIDAALDGDELTETVYETWFGGDDPLVRVDATKISDLSTFRRLIQVTRSTDGLAEVTRKTVSDPPAFGELMVTHPDATSVLFSATVANAGGDATHLYLVWGSSVGGMMPEEWENAADLGIVSSGMTYTKTLPLAETGHLLWEFILLNDEVCLHAHSQSCYAFGSACAAWIGGVSTDGTVAENWAEGTLPSEGSRILVLEGLAQGNLAYAAANVHSIGSWYQDAAVEATVDSTPEHFLTVSGDVEVKAGRLRPVSASASEVKGLCLDIGGNLTVDAAASLDASSRVTIQTGAGFLLWRASSYAGEGGRLVATEFDASGHSATYGKILDPRVTGSGSREATAGGLILLNGGGTAVVNGSIVANGSGWKNCHGAGTGGTINLTAGTLTGTGSILARGGYDTGDGNNDSGCGSGGRIRLKLTQSGADFSGFTGAVLADSVLGTKDNKEATGSDWVDRTVIGGAGTIAYQLATDGANAGLIVVRNKDWTVLGNYPFANCGGYRQFGSTHIPARSNGDTDLSKTDWVLDGQWTHAKLTQDEVKLNSLTLQNGAILKLNGKTLKLKQLRVGDLRLSGVITAETHPALFKTLTGTAADDLTRTPTTGGYFEDLADAPGTIIASEGFLVILR